MTRIAPWGKRGSERLLCAAAIAAVLAVFFALPVRADRKSDARDQFEHAVKMRTMLEGYLEKDRSLSDYRQTVSAYHKVYLISTQAEEVTPSLIAEGELYQEMGRLFDRKVFSIRHRRLQLPAEAVSGKPLPRRGHARHRANPEGRFE